MPTTLPGCSRIITSKGYERICDIFNSQQLTNVLSYNSLLDSLEYKPILSCSKIGSSAELFNISVSPKKAITAFNDFNIYTYIDGIKNIKNANVGDSLVCLDTEISEDQYQFLLGAILGDGHIAHRDVLKPQFEWGQASERKDYVYFASNLLDDAYVRVRKASKGKSEFYSFNWRHLINNKLAKTSYNTKKCINEELISELDARGLAVWFMDDGHWRHEKSVATIRRGGVNRFSGVVYLYTCGFTLVENELLKKILFNKFNLDFHIRQRNGYFYLAMGSISNIKLFFNIVAQYMIPCLQYKSPIPVGGYNWQSSKSSKIIKYPAKILRTSNFINKYKDYRNNSIYAGKKAKYSLIVADNHNFITSDCLAADSSI